MNRPIKLSVSALTLATLLCSSAVNARMFRYTDDNGRMVVSNSMPAQATKRGYQILNSQGQVVEVVAPEPTKEELAQRAADEKRKLELERQRELDTKLLRRFSEPDEAVRAMYRKIQELQSLNQLKRGNIAVVVNQLDEEQAKAADLERAGRNIPDTMLEKINRLQQQIREIEGEIASQNLEIEAVRDMFEADIKRLEEITDHIRTLPLEMPKPETGADSTPG